MVEQNSIIDPKRLRRLLRRLIDIYSPSGKEEEVLKYLLGYLKRRGLPVIRQAVDDSRYNILVVPPEADVHLALVGHVDTVVAYDLEHYAYEERDDKIIGLGAADMKSGCAAMVEAYVSAWQAGDHQLPVALVLLVGEEDRRIYSRD
jgi:acetylornithine deacetylase